MLWCYRGNIGCSWPWPQVSWWDAQCGTTETSGAAVDLPVPCHSQAEIAEDHAPGNIQDILGPRLGHPRLMPVDMISVPSVYTLNELAQDSAGFDEANSIATMLIKKMTSSSNPIIKYKVWPRSKSALLPCRKACCRLDRLEAPITLLPCSASLLCFLAARLQVAVA